MLTSLVYNVARALVFCLVVACAIWAMYVATDAISVYSNYDVMISGAVAILLLALLNPLFCFICAYGMLYYIDMPAWEVVPIVAVVFLAWLAAFVRMLLPGQG